MKSMYNKEHCLQSKEFNLKLWYIQLTATGTQTGSAVKMEGRKG